MVRDGVFYIIAVGILVVVFGDGFITKLDGIFMVAIYIAYIRRFR